MMYTYIHTLHYITLHYITLHYIALHCIALHCIALHCIALHCIALHYIALHCITLHYITLHYITLHYIHTYIYACFHLRGWNCAHKYYSAIVEHVFRGELQPCRRKPVMRVCTSLQRSPGRKYFSLHLLSQRNGNLFHSWPMLSLKPVGQVLEQNRDVASLVKSQPFDWTGPCTAAMWLIFCNFLPPNVTMEAEQRGPSSIKGCPNHLSSSLGFLIPNPIVW